MSMNDPIADMLTRIRNALSAGHDRVDIPASRIKEDLCRVLTEEGYLEGYELIETGVGLGTLRVKPRYASDGKPVIQSIKRVSKPSLRVYYRAQDIPPVRSGLGVTVMSTSRGVMTGKQAQRAGIGGEPLCNIW